MFPFQTSGNHEFNWFHRRRQWQPENQGTALRAKNGGWFAKWTPRTPLNDALQTLRNHENIAVACAFPAKAGVSKP